MAQDKEITVVEPTSYSGDYVGVKVRSRDYYLAIDSGLKINACPQNIANTLEELDSLD